MSFKTALPLAFLSLILGVLTVSGAGDTDPAFISDMLVVERENSPPRIFLADARRGHISYADAGDAEATEIGSFRQLFKCDKYPRPSALAYSHGKLVVFDSQTFTLFAITPVENTAPGGECDSEVLLGGETLKRLMEEESLEEPVSISASAAGELAFADKDSKNIILFAPQSGETKLVPRPTDTDNASRLDFSGSGLLILNDGDSIHFLPHPARGKLAEGAPPVQVKLPPNLKAELTSIRDFAFFRNIFYATDGDSVIAFANPGEESLTGDAALPVRPKSGLRELTRIAATERYLFAADRRSNSILKLARPVPATASFESPAEDSSNAQVILYRYLFEKGLLPRRRVESKRAYSSLEPLLLDEDVFLTGLSKAKGGAPGVDKSALAGMADLVCSLNGWAGCDGGRATSGKQPEARPAKINVGDKILLPNLTIETSLKNSLVPLNGRSVRDHLKKRVWPAEDKDDVNGDYILKQNEETLKKEADPFGISSGELWLPYTVWRIGILVNVDDLNDPASELRRPLAEFRRVYIFSKEQLQATPSGAAGLPVGDVREQEPCVAPPNDPLRCEVKDVRANREQLQEAIKYVYLEPHSEYNKITQTIIGIMENSRSVDRDHPDFLDEGGQSAWYIQSGAGANCTEERYVPTPPPAPGDGNAAPAEEASATALPTTGAGEKLTKDYSEVDDHGTMVAGLLASRSHKLRKVPGLLPDAGLFLIDIADTVSVESIINNLECADRRKIRIINVSSKLKAEGSLDYLKEAMANMGRLLFVVAAGNDNIDLRRDATAKYIPVEWNDIVKNIIGVGASDAEGNYATHISTRSKSHIQLIAPGVDIYSAASGKKYTMASGSSFAAPLVTAAAAQLFAQGITDPKRIKARLIYTADWRESYVGNEVDNTFKGYVWGGQLNYRQAVSHPGRNLLRTTGNASLWSVLLQGTPRIKVLTGFEDIPREGYFPLDRAVDIPFAQLLRIQTYGPREDRAKRIIYLNEHGQLRIIYRATFEVSDITLACNEAANGLCTEVLSDGGWRKSPQTFKDSQNKRIVQPENIEDYISAVPDANDIGKFGRSPW